MNVWLSFPHLEFHNTQVFVLMYISMNIPYQKNKVDVPEYKLFILNIFTRVLRNNSVKNSSSSSKNNNYNNNNNR